MASPDKADLLANRYGQLPFKKRIITPSTNQTVINLIESESGAMFYIADQTTLTINLPRLSSLSLGLNYEFYLEAQTGATESVTIKVSTLAASTNEEISGVFTSNSTITTGMSAAPASSNFDRWCRLTGLSSVVWFFQTAIQVEGDDDGQPNVFGAWTTGSTDA